MMYPLNPVPSTINPESSLQKILAIDIGAGTQDVLLYNAVLTPETVTTFISSGKLVNSKFYPPILTISRAHFLNDGFVMA